MPLKNGCYQFNSRVELMLTDEPTLMCGSEGKLFVFTCDQHISVYRIDQSHQQQHTLINRFPTHGTVQQMKHNPTAGGFLVTIEIPKPRNQPHWKPAANEYDSAGKEERTVRVYSNLDTSELSYLIDRQPVKTRVAGCVRRLRLLGRIEEEDSKYCIQMIDVHLRDSPCCIATDVRSHNFAIGVKKCVIIYGLCYRKDNRKIEGDAVLRDNENCTNRDVICLLEIAFLFKVRTLDICEEFIVCGSKDECAVIRLNFSRVTEVEDVAGGNIKDDCQLKARDMVKTLYRRSDNSGDSGFRDSGSKRDVQNREDLCHDSRGATPIVFHDVIEWDSEATMQLLRKSEAVDLEMFRQCPATVEYEFGDGCACQRSRCDILDRGVTTLLYRRQGTNCSQLISVQLSPIYRDNDHDDGAVQAKSVSQNPFLSLDRRRLQDVLVLINTSTNSYLYRTMPAPNPVSTYKYSSANVTLAHLSDGLLHAVTSSGIDVYAALQPSGVINKLDQSYACVKDQSSNSNLKGFSLSDTCSPSCFIGRYNFISTVSQVYFIPGHVVFIEELQTVNGNTELSTSTLSVWKRPNML